MRNEKLNKAKDAKFLVSILLRGNRVAQLLWAFYGARARRVSILLRGNRVAQQQITGQRNFPLTFQSSCEATGLRNPTARKALWVKGFRGHFSIGRFSVRFFSRLYEQNMNLLIFFASSNRIYCSFFLADALFYSCFLALEKCCRRIWPEKPLSSMLSVKSIAHPRGKYNTFIRIKWMNCGVVKLPRISGRCPQA